MTILILYHIMSYCRFASRHPELCLRYSNNQFFKGIQAVRIDFFLYIKSCQYSMFYTNCNWNFSQYHTSLFYFLESSKESNVYPRNIHTTWQWTRSGKCLRMCEIVDEESAWHKSNRGKMKTLTDSIWKRHKKEDSASFV